MRALALGVVFIGLALAGCDRTDSDTRGNPKAGERYAGIGTFEVGKLWAQMAGTAAPTDAAAAKLEDDEHIIVVVDTHTGEVRQCGDHSGVCVAMNPWSGPGAGLVAPVKLKKHAAEVEADDQASEEPATSAK